MLQILAQLFAGEEGLPGLRRFEAQALPLLHQHGGRLLAAFEPQGREGDRDCPDEIHLLSFPSTEAFEAYRADPRTQALAGARQRAIAKAVVYLSQRPVYYPPVEFRQADLQAHLDLCIGFRKETMRLSFGDLQKWEQECGADGQGYVQWLRDFVAKPEHWVVHLWKGEQIVGQIEYKIAREGEAPTGYVHLFYLLPEARGCGIAEQMHSYVLETFRQAGCREARLSVSETNSRALAFYRKRGWTYLQPKAEHPTVHLYRLGLANPHGD